MDTTKFKYHRGDKVILHGLMEHVNYNGTKAVVMGLRETVPNKHCPSGRAYYLDDLDAPEDWFYEERLKWDNAKTEVV